MSISEKELEKILKALANKRRFTMLKFLKKNKEASVGEIADAIKLSFRSTSKHLGVLAAADIVDKEQRGPLIFYKLSPLLNAALQNITSLF